MEIIKTVDAKGLACPMPIVKTKKAINEVESGQVIEVITTDKGSKKDFTAWAETGGHELLDMKEENDVFSFYIKKG